MSNSLKVLISFLRCQAFSPHDTAKSCWWEGRRGIRGGRWKIHYFVGKRGLVPVLLLCLPLCLESSRKDFISSQMIACDFLLYIQSSKSPAPISFLLHTFCTVISLKGWFPPQIFVPDIRGRPEMSPSLKKKI